MKDAANNTATGPMMAFAGMNMANMVGGMNSQQLYGMSGTPQQTPPTTPSPAAAAAVGAAAAPAGSWTCACGTVNTGNFCSNCGSQKPQPATWTCPKCGHQGNTGKFCSNCGTPKE